MKIAKSVQFLFKFILTALIWGGVYLFFVIPNLSVIFNFNFLDISAWEEKFLSFVNFNWRIKTLPDVLLLLMMFLWIPLYFCGLYVFFKIKWRKFLPQKKPKAVVKKVLEVKKDKPLYAKPRVMPSTIQMSKYVAPKLPNQKEERTTQAGAKSHKNVLLMIKQMAEIARKFKVEIFQHILLEGYRVPMAISTAERALMIEIVNAKGANWTVDYTDDIFQSSWFSQSNTMERLAEDLIKASEALEKAEPGSEVIKAICLTDGRVLNAKQTVDYFKSHDIYFLRFAEGQPKDEILDFASFISACFDLKEGETDPALVKIDKIPLKQKEAKESKAVNQSQPEPTNDDVDFVETDDTYQDYPIAPPTKEYVEQVNQELYFEKQETVNDDIFDFEHEDGEYDEKGNQTQFETVQKSGQFSNEKFEKARKNDFETQGQRNIQNQTQMGNASHDYQNQNVGRQAGSMEQKVVKDELDGTEVKPIAKG